MLRKFKGLLSLLLTAFLVLGAISVTGCAPESQTSVTGAKINENGELVITYSDGTQENLGSVSDSRTEDAVIGGDNYNITVNGSGENTVIASSKGLLSAVSIISNFTSKATYPSYGFLPGYGSSSAQTYSSAGSGVIYSIDKSQGNAIIITNYHVVYDSSSNTENGISSDIEVYLYGSEIEGQAIKAEYVGGSMYYDLAVLSIENSELIRSSSAACVTFADSDNVSVGEVAIAIGNAEGYGISATYGVVSVDSEHIAMTASDGRTNVAFRVMRVDTAINSGNSGGGLFNSNGELIGIVNAKVQSSSVENIGYALPSRIVLSVVQNVMDHCYNTDVERVQRANLGITVTANSSKAVLDKENVRLRIVEEVSVYEIASGALADNNLQKGDIIKKMTLNGKEKNITRQYHVIDFLIDARVGDTVIFSIVRSGVEMDISITINANAVLPY